MKLSALSISIFISGAVIGGPFKLIGCSILLLNSAELVVCYRFNLKYSSLHPTQNGYTYLLYLRSSTA
jgi:hypothetical protein